MRIHAIVLALNEEVFIANQLRALYSLCSGISVVTQYDRDWYGRPIEPDRTIALVADFPDPEGKIHLVLRRYPDEAAARNSEMLALGARPDRGILSHGSSVSRIESFHRPPDYFFIVDADEFYDPETLPGILQYLQDRRPRGMRVHGINYVHTWNRRVPREIVPFCHFGFLRPGVLFTMRRIVSWNESRLQKLLRICRLPDVSARLWGFIECPPEVGIFHHGCWLGGRGRLIEKASKSSHQENNFAAYPEMIDTYPTTVVPTDQLPRSIREVDWPLEFFDRTDAFVADHARTEAKTALHNNNPSRNVP
jgi:hypothetical protein